MPVNKNELTKEQIAKAMACETVEELMALAKAEGIELTNVAGGLGGMVSRPCGKFYK